MEQNNEFNRFSLLKCIVVAIREKNVVDLEKAIVNHEKDVILSQDTELLRIYSLACLYVNDANRAYVALMNVKNSEEVRALIAFQDKNYASVVGNFKDVKPKTSAGKIALSVSMYESERTVFDCEKVLDSIIVNNSTACTIAGIMNFNSKFYDAAENYFSQATLLAPKDMITWNNLMSAYYVNDKVDLAYRCLNLSLMVNGNSAPDLMDKMKRTKINFPKLELSGQFYNIASQLI